MVMLTVQSSPLDVFENDNELAAKLQTEAGTFAYTVAYFSHRAFCVKLLAMGNKDRGKKETKKAPKPKPKPEPSRREMFTPAPPSK